MLRRTHSILSSLSLPNLPWAFIPHRLERDTKEWSHTRETCRSAKICSSNLAVVIVSTNWNLILEASSLPVASSWPRHIILFPLALLTFLNKHETKFLTTLRDKRISFKVQAISDAKGSCADSEEKLRSTIIIVRSYVATTISSSSWEPWGFSPIVRCARVHFSRD